jgi:hypothetical protein
VGFQDEERMVEEQRSVAAELSARGRFRHAFIAPSRVGFFQKVSKFIVTIAA